MAVVVITGSQWGDEGKGKLAHYLGAGFDLTVRFQGGSNAGHTVKTGGETFKFNLLPSAILHRDHQCLMADGMVVNPARLIGEIRCLQDKGLWGDNLLIGSRAHLVMPYHILQDELHEKSLGDHSIGTTKQGIGPCYADKFARTGIQVGDLLNPKTLRQRLEDVVPHKNALLRNVYGYDGELSVDALYGQLMEQAEVIAPLVVSSVKTVRSLLDSGANVLCEGAQGALLDIDYGTYPFVTSSHTVTAGACLGTGIAPCEITRTIGVSKAYTTRVGNGAFPSEQAGLVWPTRRTARGLRPARFPTRNWPDTLRYTRSFPAGRDPAVLRALRPSSPRSSRPLWISWSNRLACRSRFCRSGPTTMRRSSAPTGPECRFCLLRLRECTGAFGRYNPHWR